MSCDMSQLTEHSLNSDSSNVLSLAGLHSLEFLSTGRVQPGSPSSFDQLTVFDGVPISHCGSLTRTEEFKPSLESHDLPTRCEDACIDVLVSLAVLPSLTNSTVGEF